jgi:hypothetical protein
MIHDMYELWHHIESMASHMYTAIIYRYTYKVLHIVLPRLIVNTVIVKNSQ